MQTRQAVGNLAETVSTVAQAVSTTSDGLKLLNGALQTQTSLIMDLQDRLKKLEARVDHLQGYSRGHI